MVDPREERRGIHRFPTLTYRQTLSQTLLQHHRPPSQRHGPKKEENQRMRVRRRSTETVFNLQLEAVVAATVILQH